MRSSTADPACKVSYFSTKNDHTSRLTLHAGYFTKHQLTNETVQNQTLQVITTRMTLHLWTKTSGIYCNYLSRPPSADRNDSPTSPWTHLFNTKMTIVTVECPMGPRKYIRYYCVAVYIGPQDMERN